MSSLCFFFNSPATSYIYTLSLHDALPIFAAKDAYFRMAEERFRSLVKRPLESDTSAEISRYFQIRKKWDNHEYVVPVRSEEHTSELQSLRHLVCRLLLEKKKTKKPISVQR